MPKGARPINCAIRTIPAHVIGFEVDLADALAEILSRRLGMPITAEFVQYQWESLELGLPVSQDFDCIISGYEITPARQADHALHAPLLRLCRTIGRAPTTTSAFTTLADCHDHAVGTLAGSAAERLLNEHGRPRGRRLRRAGRTVSGLGTGTARRGAARFDHRPVLRQL